MKRFPKMSIKKCKEKLIKKLTKKSMKKSKKNTEFVMKNISLLFRIFLDFSGEIIFDYC